MRLTATRPRLVIVASTGALGGAEQSYLPVIALLREQGVAVEAVTFGLGGFADALTELGVRTRVVDLPDGVRTLSRAYGRSSRMARPRVAVGAAAAVADVSRALGRVPRAPVLALGFRAQLAATPAARVRRRPVAWWVADVIPATFPGRLWRAASRGAGLILTYPGTAAGQPMLRGHRGVVAIENGIDLTAFGRPAPPPQEPPLVGMVGHLTPWKNHLGFLRVVERLREGHGAVEAVILGAETYDTAGHAEYAARVRAAATAAGVPLIAAAPAEVRGWLERMSVVVHLPTLPETFGRSSVEAMATGRPVVAYRIGATAETVADGRDGILCPPGDEAAAAAAVARLLGDPALRARLGANARTDALARFDRRRTAAAMAGALRTWMGAGGAQPTGAGRGTGAVRGARAAA